MNFFDNDGNVIFTVPLDMFAAVTFFRCYFEQEKRVEPAHKMFVEVIKSLGGVLHTLVIDDLRKGIFYATLYFKDYKGDECSIKLLAGDALAMSFAASCWIYVKESVFVAAKSDRKNRAKWYDFRDKETMARVRAYSIRKLRKLPVDELEQLLEIAAEVEDFEFAARIKKAME
jgi:bifunctional DNase/RNase